MRYLSIEVGIVSNGVSLMMKSKWGNPMFIRSLVAMTALLSLFAFGTSAHALDKEQRGVINAALQAADQRKASPKEIKAMLAAGWVECRWHNCRHGHIDSLGWLQQRPSMGWGSARQIMRPSYAAHRFLAVADKRNTRGKNAATLAQAVQASAFPARYHQAGPLADSVMRPYLRKKERQAKRKKARQQKRKEARIERRKQARLQQKAQAHRQQ
jgi:hypothetical protein